VGGSEKVKTQKSETKQCSKIETSKQKQKQNQNKLFTKKKTHKNTTTMTTTKAFVRLSLSMAFLTVLCPMATLSRVAALDDMDVSVLEDHRVVYSSPKVQTKYQSAAR